MCEKMIAAMPEIELDGLTGVDGITWGADGEPNKAPKGVIIQDGVYTSMD